MAVQRFTRKEMQKIISEIMDQDVKVLPIGNHELRRHLVYRVIAGDEDFVFKYANRPIKDLRDGLKRACAKSKIKYGRFIEGGFIFHDLRRTFITNARKAGVRSNVTNNITGHSNRGNMNARYDQIDDSDLIKAIDKIEGYLENVSETVSKTQNQVFK